MQMRCGHMQIPSCSMMEIGAQFQCGLLLLFVCGSRAASIHQLADPAPSNLSCRPVSDIPLCSGVGYANASFPNLRGQQTLEEASEAIASVLPLVQSRCSNATLHFLCAVYAPICLEGVKIQLQPCGNLCEQVRDSCEAALMQLELKWPPQLDCDTFPAEVLCYSSPELSALALQLLPGPLPDPTHHRRQVLPSTVGLPIPDQSPTASPLAGECDNGTIRLVGGATASEGRVELCLRGVWGTVCSDRWDDTEAEVVCRQLARPYVDPEPRSFGPGGGPIHLDSVSCQGSEAMLTDCRYSEGRDCGHSQDAGVICHAPDNCTEGEVRLVGGADVTMGRVEICYNQRWGSVCDDLWDETNAQVVCKQLGLEFEGAMDVCCSTYGIGEGPIHIDNVQCTGTELLLADCRHRGVGVHDCVFYEHAGVICAGLVSEPPPTTLEPPTPEPCASGSIRLVEAAIVVVEGEGPVTQGKVELCIDEVWRIGCGVTWDEPEATVACRQLGLPFLGASSRLWNTATTEPVYAALIECTGSEEQLLTCTHQLLGADSCGQADNITAAGVACQGMYTDNVLSASCTVRMTTMNGVAINCHSNRDKAVMACSFDGRPFHLCYFPMIVTDEVFPEGPHSLTVITTDCSGFSVVRTVNYSIPSLRKNLPADVPPLVVVFTNNTPSLELDTVKLVFDITRPAVSVRCGISGHLASNCSSGVAVFSNISSGTHTVRVVASNGGGDRVVERRKVVVMAPGGSSCSAHLINKGLTVLQDAATVEFTAQGRHVYSSCSLDGQSPFPCVSPVEIQELELGSHLLRIRPEGCPGKSYPLVLKFTSGEPHC